MDQIDFFDGNHFHFAGVTHHQSFPSGDLVEFAFKIILNKKVSESINTFIEQTDN